MSKAAQAHVDVAVLGQTYCDLVFEGAPLSFAPGTETFASNLVVTAGGAATRAVAAARLGVRSALVSELGDDPFGHIVRAGLDEEANLDLSWCVSVEATPVTVALTSAVDRAFLSYDGGRTTPSIDVDVLPAARYLHIGLAEGITDGIRERRAAGTKIVAGVGWDGNNEWPQAHIDALVDVDIFCPNADEAMAYTGTSTLGDALDALAPLVPLLIVTDGPRGAWVAGRDREAPSHVGGYAATSVDPTGAGDVFIAAAMVELARGEDVLDAVRFANAAAALAVSALGGSASAPTRAAVQDLVSRTPDAERTRA